MSRTRSPVNILLLFGVSFLAVSALALRGAPKPVVEPRAHKDPDFQALFSRTNGWVAGDGALSVPLPDGRTVWLFGDSHIDDFDASTGTIPCLFQARNAAFLLDPRDLRNVTTLAGHGRGFRSWYKNSADENEWFWP